MFSWSSGSVPSIEDILMSNLNEANTTDEKELQRHPKAKEFIKQVWNIHHSGQPLPTEQNEPEDSDIIIAQVCQSGGFYIWHCFFELKD